MVELQHHSPYTPSRRGIRLGLYFFLYTFETATIPSSDILTGKKQADKTGRTIWTALHYVSAAPIWQCVNSELTRKRNAHSTQNMFQTDSPSRGQYITCYRHACQSTFIVALIS
jgi:hypothetical protein